ncbi:MAG: hypothetical protein A3I05_07140 [Deltaproteobacteria bacterium RIFCSPLOWO2_02_FULL_44_10]|nr:MAG: hypothetical protein A3C46_04120 [Deltaproteobacteria bacterium RIFCSPHIGHO2_02_FULL_44_16]OGQ46366.1 MAG: hypothetical protein A3I05_07140 [Deltaproteobacteria bacterium RIFCSPLOWO2_02_FULL_44_10]
MNKKQKPQLVQKIISGGQTGVDRAALDAAIELHIPCGGWCPKGRLAEDGILDLKYPLKETSLGEYKQRTQWNMRDSDGTLILTFGEPQGGTRFTIDCAKKFNKPYLIINLKREPKSEEVIAWMEQHQIQVLNVAGPRESSAPGMIYKKAKLFIMKIFQK